MIMSLLGRLKGNDGRNMMVNNYTERKEKISSPNEVGSMLRSLFALDV